jgi:hypothetical protein
MTSTEIRQADAVYSDLFATDGTDCVYPKGTMLCVVSYDDGDRFVTRAPRELVEAAR